MPAQHLPDGGRLLVAGIETMAGAALARRIETDARYTLVGIGEQSD